jgi:hypothetical protein
MNSRMPAVWNLRPVPEEVEVPAQVEFGRLDGHQAAAPEGLAQRQARNAADAETELDGTLDRFGMLQFQPDRQGRMLMAQRLVEGLARPRSGFANDPCLFGQFRQRRLPCLASGCAGAQNTTSSSATQGSTTRSGCRHDAFDQPRSSSWRAS